MLSRKVPLDGDDWKIRSFYGEDWTWIDAHKASMSDDHGWYPASVPGSIQADLAQAGLIPDPYHEQNSLLAEWVPQRTWVYRKSFYIEEGLKGRRISLNFGGVDYECRFYLNGTCLGRSRSMFVTASFDVSQLLIYGAQNLLAVILEPAPSEPSQFGNTTLARAHKPRMNYWWDFCPRIINLGICDSVYLEATGQAWLEDSQVRTSFKPGGEQGIVDILSVFSCQEEMPVTMETRLYLDEHEVASEMEETVTKKGKNSWKQRFTLTAPHLWWPNGSGEQPLYLARTRILLPDGSVSDEKEVRFGFRHVQLSANEGAGPELRPWTFIVNGRKTFIKGWNWVPMDALYGVDRQAKLERLLKLAKAAHVNLLRVWGGGLIEKEAFYKLCDDYGIMVWQEFVLSCSGLRQYPSDDPGYVAYLGEEAEGIIKARRNHPSLVLWCGGNELCTDLETPVEESNPAIATLHAAVARLDPDRIWLATSPSHKPRSKVEIHGPWNYLGLSSHYQHYDSSTSLFYSEFGTEGITNLKTLNKVIDPVHQWPVDLANPIWFHLASWWIRPEWRTLYGEATDVLSLQRATQFTQAEGLKYALEAGRRRKYRNSGTIPWQFNEPFPMAACTSAVDYYAFPKPAYYAAARAYEPVHISAVFSTIAWSGQDDFRVEIWLSSSLEQEISEAVCHARLVGMTGKVYAVQEHSFEIPANRSARIADFAHDLSKLKEQVFFLDLRLLDRSGQALSSNRYIFSRAATLAPLLSESHTELGIQVEVKDKVWDVDLINQGDTTALFVWLEDARPIGDPGYAYFQDNYFSLFPGENRTIHSLWEEVRPEDRIVEIGAWNTEKRNLKPRI